MEFLEHSFLNTNFVCWHFKQKRRIHLAKKIQDKIPWKSNDIKDISSILMTLALLHGCLSNSEYAYVTSELRRVERLGNRAVSHL